MSTLAIENIENKYHRYLMRNAINVHNKHAEENYRIMEGYESMVNIGIHLIDLLCYLFGNFTKVKIIKSDKKSVKG